MTTRQHLPTRLRPVVAIAAASFVLVMTGCGSSSDGKDSSPTTEPAATSSESTTTAGSSDELSEDDWREQANSICTETAPDIGAAFGAMDPAAPTDAQVENVVQTLIDVNRDTQTRIEALDEPSSIADQVRALLDANEEVTATIEEQGPAVLDTLDQLFAPVNEMATDLGLDACAG